MTVACGRRERGVDVAAARRGARRRCCGRVVDARRRRPLSPCTSGAPGCRAASRVEDGGQHLVLDVDESRARARRRADGLGDDGGDPLAAEADARRRARGCRPGRRRGSRGARWRRGVAGASRWVSTASTPGSAGAARGVDRRRCGRARAGCRAPSRCSRPVVRTSRVYGSRAGDDPRAAARAAVHRVARERRLAAARRCARPSSASSIDR